MRLPALVWLALISLVGSLLISSPAAAEDVSPTTDTTTAPRIVDTVRYGGTAVADLGSAPAGSTVQWNVDQVPVSGATGTTYRPVRADVGRRLSVTVTPPDDGDALTSFERTVGWGVITMRARPRIYGTPKQGRTLVAGRGAWNVPGLSYAYQWYDGSRPIRGATSSRFTPQWWHVDDRVGVRVTVWRSGYASHRRWSSSVRVAHAVAVRRTVTYSVATRGRITQSLSTFKQQAQQTFDDPRGWRTNGIRFRRVSRGGSFTLVLSQASKVPTFSSACSSAWSCRVGRHVVINQDRWRSATSSWRSARGSLRDYRHMVVNHETGHWLGRGHATCRGKGRLAPVMMQQSKSLKGCRFNPWPTPAERYAPRYGF